MDADASAPVDDGPPAEGEQPRREGDVLMVFFPAPTTFNCTETGCNSGYSPASWTSRRQSLQRHLEAEHGIRIRETINTCSNCSDTLGLRPTIHVCRAGGSSVVVPTRQRHGCPECDLTFPSKKGLNNHGQWHRKEAARLNRGNSAPAIASPVCSGRRETQTAEQPTENVSTPHTPDVTLSQGSTAGPSDGSSLVTSRIPATTSGTASLVAPAALPTPIGGEEVFTGTYAADQPTIPPLPEETVAPLDERVPELTSPGQHTGELADSGTSVLSENCDNGGVDEGGAAEASGIDPITQQEINPEDNVLSPFVTRLRRLRGELASPEMWAEFEEVLEAAMEAVSRAVQLPAVAPEGRAKHQVNPENPQQIQRLYRKNRRRAVRLIVEGPSALCSIPVPQLESHFTSVWSAKEVDTTIFHHKTQAASEVYMAVFSSEEVAGRLRKCENTTPGEDRLTYEHWRSVDPEGIFLAAVFNICLHHRRVPDSWRKSRTVLIYKKGDRGDPTNWRPISLGTTISKLYAGCLAARMQQWISDEDVLCRSQKGFLPHDGVFEHNFVLQERMDAARTGGGDICVGFLDFANAFGSVAHSAVEEAVRSSGAGEAFTAIIRDLYDANTTTIVAEGGSTDPITISAGIRQGCPLSGVLFNLVIDPVVRAVQGGERRHNILAYADDLTPLADDIATLQTRIDLIATMSERLGLRLNPAKCRTLHLSGQMPVGTRPTVFSIRETAIPVIEDFDSHEFLGRPIGYRVIPPEATVNEAIDLGKRLLSSMLAPWQRIDAIRTFLFPALNFSMRMGTLGKDTWKRLDDALRPLIKRTLYLPSNAANDYLYGSAAAGAAGIPVAADVSDACRIDNAFKLLSSPDPEVRELALNAVTEVTTRRLRRPASTDDVEQYLSGETEGEFRATATQLQSVWTEARKASRRLGVTWTVQGDGAYIECGGNSLAPRHRRKVLRTLRSMQTSTRDASLHQMPNQGKVMECVAADRASSHFMRSGNFTRFTDWRFVHRARLNLLPLNGARPWAPATDQRCRRCGHTQETLPHVLCHCMTQSRALTERHNAIVKRVKTASMGRLTVTHENQPVGDTTLRPDLVLARGEEAIVLDVCVPFENRPAALQEARATKIAKYQPVRQFLLRRFQKVTVEAIVVGALGSWDPGNDKVLRRVCSRRYLQKMKKLMVSETIAASRDIYARHTVGSR